MQKKLNRVKLAKYLLLLFMIALVAFSLLWNPKTGKVKVAEVQAQNTQDHACVGRELAEYLRTVAINAGPLARIQLLSPAFNITNPNGAAIANAMSAAPGTNWISLVNGIAVNAYNCCGKLVTDHVVAFRTDFLSHGNRPILITETGVYDHGIPELRSQLDRIQSSQPGSGGPYIGALLFNAFKTGSAEWDRFGFDSDDQILHEVCGDSCHNIGVNSAQNYWQRDVGSFYGRARGLGMHFTLEIANADESTTIGVRHALDHGLTPVIRLGTAHSAGPDAVTYGRYLANLEIELARDYPGRTVYAIAGPNEPQSECWAAPACGCDLSPVVWEDNIDHPLEKGFYLGRYSCTQTANPEFHPIRPYPASACDPLIPRSDPEAPTVTIDEILRSSGDDITLSDYQRYNTFACGSNMEFSHLEGFDPYGFFDKYNENDTVGIVEDSFGNQFLHTYCETPTLAQQQSTSYYDQVCYRTIAYNLYTDFSTTNIGILGNTQNKDFTEEQKVNNYLSWYFTGTPQIGDNVLLDHKEEEDMDRLVNLSGPVRKLLPYEAMLLIREVLKFAILGDSRDDPTYDIHDYALNEQHTVRISTVNESISEFFPHIPNSTLEDIAGEAFFTSYGGFGVGARGPEATEENPEPLTTAPYSLNITCGVGAHLDCPATGPFRIGGPHVPGGGGGGPGCAILPGQCMPPGETCCGREVTDLTCFLTEARCTAGGCSILPGQCMPPGETCCGVEVPDEGCFLTEARCTAG